MKQWKGSEVEIAHLFDYSCGLWYITSDYVS